MYVNTYVYVKIGIGRHRGTKPCYWGGYWARRLGPLRGRLGCRAPLSVFDGYKVLRRGAIGALAPIECMALRPRPMPYARALLPIPTRISCDIVNIYTYLWFYMYV